MNFSNYDFHLHVKFDSSQRQSEAIDRSCVLLRSLASFFDLLRPCSIAHTHRYIAASRRRTRQCTFLSSDRSRTQERHKFVPTETVYFSF